MDLSNEDGSRTGVPFARPAPAARARSRAELQPVARDLCSLRVTVDEAFKRDLEELAALTSHTTRGDLRAVLHEALRCGIAKHGKRRGAVEPERKPARRKDVPCAERGASDVLPSRRRAANEPAPAAMPSAPVRDPEPMPRSNPAASGSPAPRDPRFIPMEVRRAVWERDGGRCAWVSAGGRRCGSRYQVEVDHLEPVARGGQSTLANTRLAGKAHNIHEAFVLGFETMAPHLGKLTDPSDGDEG